MDAFSNSNVPKQICQKKTLWMTLRITLLELKSNVTNRGFFIKNLSTVYTQDLTNYKHD